jgi:hypothetical protein
MKPTIDKKEELKNWVNDALRQETLKVFGYAGETFDSCYERINADEQLFDAWHEWKYNRVPQLRVQAMTALNILEDYSKLFVSDKYESRREHLKYRKEQPDVRINGRTIETYKQYNKLVESESIKPSEWVRRVMNREIARFSQADYELQERVIKGSSSQFASIQIAKDERIAELKKKIDILEATLDKASTYSQEQQEQHKERIDQLTKAYTDSLIELEALAA